MDPPAVVQPDLPFDAHAVAGPQLSDGAPSNLDIAPVDVNPDPDPLDHAAPGVNEQPVGNVDPLEGEMPLDTLVVEAAGNVDGVPFVPHSIL